MYRFEMTTALRIIAERIAAEIDRYPHITSGDASDGKSATSLIAELKRKGIPERGFLTHDELNQIAAKKNGDRLPRRTTGKAIMSNSAEAVRELTRIGMASDDPELAIRPLLSLEGVRLPTASAILSWTYPEKWAVIDIRAWTSLLEIAGFRVKRMKDDGAGGKGIWRVGNWIDYMGIIHETVELVGRTPREVDLWLYWYDKTVLGNPEGFSKD
jgi:hypothetical protein